MRVRAGVCVGVLLCFCVCALVSACVHACVRACVPVFESVYVPPGLVALESSTNNSHCFHTIIRPCRTHPPMRSTLSACCMTLW